MDYKIIAAKILFTRNNIQFIKEVFPDNSELMEILDYLETIEKTINGKGETRK